MNKSFFYFLTLFSLLGNFHAERIYLKTLAKEITQVIELKQNYSNDYDKKLKKVKDENKIVESELKCYPDLINLGNLIKGIKENPKPIGKGGYGIVFKVDGVDYQEPTLPHVYAVKLINFLNDAKKSEAKDSQNALLDEIKIAKDLAKYDKDYLFFPRYYGFYEATDSFKKNNPEDGSLSEIFLTDENHDKAAIVMEYFDMSLENYFDDIAANRTNSLFVTRLRIYLNLGQALLKIIKDYTHCDIKPENIMLREISEAESIDFESKGLEPLELYPNKYYQLKLIDFGISVKGKPQKRECFGGTPGYAPLEIFEKNVSNGKFDLFSVAVIIADFELLDQKFFGFNPFLTFGFRYIQKVNKQEAQNYEMNEEDLTRIQKYSFFLMGQLFWNNQLMRDKYIELLKKYLPADMEARILANYSVDELKQLTYLEVFKKNADALFPIAFANLDYYFNIQYLSMLNRSNGQYNNEMQKHQQQMNSAVKDSEEYNKARDMVDYFTNLITLKVAESQKKIDLINHLLKILGNKPKDRPSNTDTFALIENMIQDITYYNWAQLSHITMINRIYGMVGMKATENPEFSLEKQMKLQAEKKRTRKCIRPDFRRLI